MRVNWLGEASFEIETEGRVIFIDPHLTSSNIDKADIILLTHDHLTHADEVGVENVKKKETLVLSSDNTAKKLGLSAKITSIGEHILYEDVLVSTISAYVQESPSHRRGLGLGYIIEAEGKRVYHAGVSSYIPEMLMVDEIDLAIMVQGIHNKIQNQEILRIIQTINPHTLGIVFYGGIADNLEQIKMIVEASSHTTVYDFRLGELHF